MKLMKTVLKYGAVFGAGAIGGIAMYVYGAILNHDEPFLSTDEVLIVKRGDDSIHKIYKVVAHTGVAEVGDTSLGTIERII